MKKTFLLLTLIVFSAMQLKATTLKRVEPANWWIGMQNPNLQLLVQGRNIGNTEVYLDYGGVELQSVEKADSPNYLFVNLKISEHTQAGTFDLIFKDGEKQVASFPYELKRRKKGAAARKGFDSSDAVYLLMPDRFANGNPNNDTVEGMLEPANKEIVYGRYGGDIEGIIQHLDYIEELGMTAIWSTPMMEDNLPEYSYHGYAISDYYKIDPRYGTNEDYKRLSEKAASKGIKLILDVVTNHSSTTHWWMQDLPFQDWVHQFPEFTRTNYRMATLNDPHASQADKNLNSNGWFDTTMPDLNQKNPYLMRYFTQCFIWWIEYADLGGLRIDTYPYNDLAAMAKFCKDIMTEYPNFNIVGECWQHNPLEIAYWQRNARNHDGYNTHMPSVMDFPLTDALNEVFNESEGWSSGMNKLYELFALDYVYPDWDNLFTFADNHDTERLAKTLQEDPRKIKMAMGVLGTVRGIPQIYYGTAIMLNGNHSLNHGDSRKPFPGGWAHDPVNAFTAEGRTDMQNEVFNFIKTLFQYRKHNPVLHTGKMMQFLPEGDTYAYFRYNDQKTVMIVLNNNEEAKELETARFAEIIKTHTQALNVVTGESLADIKTLKLPAKSISILELK